MAYGDIMKLNRIHMDPKQIAIQIVISEDGIREMFVLYERINKPITILWFIIINRYVWEKVREARSLQELLKT